MDYQTEILKNRTSIDKLEGEKTTMAEDIKEIKNAISKATNWVIGIMLSIIGTFILDKFF
jgi:F0F1-type ATP synthase assembly protein I